MGRAGPRRVGSYSPEFKLRAVQLSEQPGVLVRDVAESLCIHPFMLSRWRKQARDGEGTVSISRTMVERLIGEEVKVRVVVSPGLGRVKADRGQLGQVVMNLALGVVP
jgi:transposase-like protein